MDELIGSPLLFRRGGGLPCFPSQGALPSLGKPSRCPLTLSSLDRRGVVCIGVPFGGFAKKKGDGVRFLVYQIGG